MKRLNRNRRPSGKAKGGGRPAAHVERTLQGLEHTSAAGDAASTAGGVRDLQPVLTEAQRAERARRHRLIVEHIASGEHEPMARDDIRAGGDLGPAFAGLKRTTRALSRVEHDYRNGILVANGHEPEPFVEGMRR